MLVGHPDVTDVRQERRTLQGVLPDVSFRLRAHRVAIEVQVTAISISTIQQRVQRYTELGISLLWVLPWNTDLVEGGRYRPTQREKFLHSLYRGKVFYWSPDQVLQPISYLDMTTTGELFHWYEDKDEWRRAGQPRKAKVAKLVHLLPHVQITDLVSVIYPAWETEQLSLPEAKLWPEGPEFGFGQKESQPMSIVVLNTGRGISLPGKKCFKRDEAELARAFVCQRCSQNASF